MTGLRSRTLGALAVAFFVAACGSAGERPLSSVTRTLAGGISAAIQGDDTGGGDAALEAQLTRAALDKATRPLLLAELPSRDARATFVIGGQNRAHVTWVGADGIGLILKNGILTGTRGLGADLMTADIATPEAAIRRGGGTATRVHRYLDGENQIVALPVTCTYASAGATRLVIVERAFPTRQVVENCTSGSHNFENRYWIDTRDGWIWKSQQWIGPELETVTLTHLVR